MGATLFITGFALSIAILSPELGTPSPRGIMGRLRERLNLQSPAAEPQASRQW